MGRKYIPAFWGAAVVGALWGAARRPARLPALLLLLSLSAACVSRPADIQEVRFDSRSFAFVDELLAGDAGRPQQVGAVFVLPPDAVAKPPYPAIVLLHTSYGQGAQDWLYLRRLRESGVAVLAVDSFSARGVSHTVRDQTLVSTASMLADAFAGLDYLAADPHIDPARIGIMGFSKGGIAALYSAYAAIQQRVSLGGRRFALHIAYYPWCGLRLYHPVTTGAPVLIQTGALDDVVPAERCAGLIAASRGPEGPPGMQLIVHPDARHGFDHPLLALFGNLPMSAPSPASCELRQMADGNFVELHSGTAVDRDKLGEALAPCSRTGHAGGNEAADAAAFANTLAFLRAGGFLPPSGEALQ